jgi:hypothetical protein
VEFPPDLPSLAFALTHLLDAVGDAHRALEAAQHDRQFARRERAVAERFEHGLQGSLRIVRAGDGRQFKRRRPVGPARPGPLRAYPHGDGVTAPGEKNDPVCRLQRPLGELFLHGDGLLVARAGRATGGIAALAWLESHDGNSLCNRYRV